MNAAPAPFCWICFGDEADEPELLRRDCSCRGTDAGFVHLSCLVEYAKKKNIAWDEDEVGCQDMNELTEPWRVCPNCKQDYQNTLSVDIANEFVSFVKRQHPNNMQKHAEGLYLKLWTLRKSLKPVQIDEVKEVATTILEMIGQLKVETPMLPKIMKMEAFTHNGLGLIALREGKEESAKEALIHFEKNLELSTAINYAAGIADAEYNIALAKSKYERCDVRHNEVQLKVCQDLYESYVASYGEEHTCTINTGVQLAIVLWNANRVIEADELLTRLVTVSGRVHGPQHEATKNAELWLQKINARQAG